jgi:hypothetical protein
LGPVGLYSTDFKTPIAANQKQSEIALGGLVGFYFDRFLVQAFVTSNVYEQNYGGSAIQAAHRHSAQPKKHQTMCNPRQHLAACRYRPEERPHRWRRDRGLAAARVGVAAFGRSGSDPVAAIQVNAALANLARRQADAWPASSNGSSDKRGEHLLDPRG